MTVLDVLKVLSPYEKVKIYNDNVVWCSGKMTVVEARELPNLDTLPVGSIWYNESFSYFVIDVEVS